MSRKKHWSKTVEESGVRVRIYERANFSAVVLRYSEWPEAPEDPEDLQPGAG